MQLLEADRVSYEVARGGTRLMRSRFRRAPLRQRRYAYRSDSFATDLGDHGRDAEGPAGRPLPGLWEELGRATPR